jgi:heme exporter protein C
LVYIKVLIIIIKNNMYSNNRSVRCILMKFNDYFYLTITIAINIIASYAALIAAPPEVHMGDLYRIFYIHLPVALICYLTLGISLLASIAFLIKRKQIYDRIAKVSAILGLVYGAIVLVTGSIWANAVWGVYWNWDPRETTTLILWIAYIGYIALRLSIENEDKRALMGAVYNVLAFSTVPLSYLSFIIWQSLHPRIISGSGIAITLPMMETLFLNFIAASLVYIYILKVTYNVYVLQDKINKLVYERRR